MGSADKPDDSAGRGDRQRLDKWLWFARVARTRPAAAALVVAGHVRMNGRRVALPAKPVAPGDVLTIALEREVRVLRVVGIGLRRGPYRDASTLFEELAAGSLPGARSGANDGLGGSEEWAESGRGRS